MKIQKVFSILLAIMIVVAVIPFATVAEAGINPQYIRFGSEKVERNGTNLPKGVSWKTENRPNNWVLVFDNYKGPGVHIVVPETSTGAVQVYFKGENVITAQTFMDSDGYEEVYGILCTNGDLLSDVELRGRGANASLRIRNEDGNLNNVTLNEASFYFRNRR